ncbi:hypothetical protein J6590_046778 [Homalodisca vitripennis]|nr:hypothetical protein J6590_046778 [Homalodisca vitripennis]
MSSIQMTSLTPGICSPEPLLQTDVGAGVVRVAEAESRTPTSRQSPGLGHNRSGLNWYSLHHTPRNHPSSTYDHETNKKQKQKPHLRSSSLVMAVWQCRLLLGIVLVHLALSSPSVRRDVLSLTHEADSGPNPLSELQPLIFDCLRIRDTAALAIGTAQLRPLYLYDVIPLLSVTMFLIRVASISP